MRLREITTLFSPLVVTQSGLDKRKTINTGLHSSECQWMSSSLSTSTRSTISSIEEGIVVDERIE